jgi:hypothetical protein
MPRATVAAFEDNLCTLKISSRLVEERQDSIFLQNLQIVVQRLNIDQSRRIC